MKLSLFATVQDLKSCLQPLVFFKPLIKLLFLRKLELPLIQISTNQKSALIPFKNYRLHDLKLIF